jgi:hypothetical protein
VKRNGDVTINIPVGNGADSTLKGKATINSGQVTLSGNFETISNGSQFVVGTFQGTRVID